MNSVGGGGGFWSSSIWRPSTQILMDVLGMVFDFAIWLAISARGIWIIR